MTGTPRPLRRSGDLGYSMIEILAVILVMGIVAFFGVGSFQKWALAATHEGMAVDMQTVLRQTQTRAITEGTSFCVTFDTDQNQYTVYRYACGTAIEQVKGPFKVADPRITLASPQFLQADGSYKPWLTFKPTGTATPGTVTVRRAAAPKAYVVAVEGFTGRVSYS